MSKQVLKFIRNLVLALAALGLLVLIVPRVVTTVYAWTRVDTLEAVPAQLEKVLAQNALKEIRDMFNYVL